PILEKAREAELRVVREGGAAEAADQADRWGAGPRHVAGDDRRAAVRRRPDSGWHALRHCEGRATLIFRTPPRPRPPFAPGRTLPTPSPAVRATAPRSAAPTS